MAVSITGEMRDLVNSALADRVPCVLGTATKDGVPQISMKGSITVYDEQTLAYWERSRRTALENIRENPHVVVFYRNPDKRINWRFHGAATVHESGPVRDEVMNLVPKVEVERDAERKGVAVLIRVDKITDLSGKVLQQRHEGE